MYRDTLAKYRGPHSSADGDSEWFQRDGGKVDRQSNRQARTEHLDRRPDEGDGVFESVKDRYPYRIDCTEE